MLHSIIKYFISKYAGSKEHSRLIIFNFHNIYKENCVLKTNSTPYNEFETQIRWIHQYFTVLPLEEGIEACRSAKLTKPTACITFDDGYKSQYSLAKPLLDKLGISGTFFISSGHLNHLQWNDHIPLFFHAANQTEQSKLLHELSQITGQECPVKTSSENIKTVDKAIKYLPLAKRVPLLKLMRDVIPDHLVQNVMMTKENVIDLSNSPHSIGGHTANHPILSQETDTVSYHEIMSDKEYLEKLTGKKINVFAYPNGKAIKDYTSRDIQVLLKNKISYAVTTTPGYFSPGSDPYQIPRFNLSGTNPIKFLKTTLSAYRQLGQTLESLGYEKTC